MEAALNGYTERLQLQLRNGADVDYKMFGTTALLAAAYGGFDDCGKILLDAGSNVNEPGFNDETPLMGAVRHGHVEVAQRLLSTRGIRKEAKNGYGHTALHVAARFAQIPCLKLLVEHGCDANAVDNDEKTPLHWAAESGQMEAFQTLAFAGSDSTAPDVHGTTPVDIAVRSMKGPDSVVFTMMNEVMQLFRPRNNAKRTLHPSEAENAIRQIR